MKELSVYIADDHALVREGLEALLRVHEEIQILGQAGDGRTALREIRNLDPDVALLDITMPALSGVQVASRLLAEAPRTRCVMLSVHCDGESIFRAFRAGVCGYVLKDAPSSDVVAAVRAAANGGHFLSQVVMRHLINEYVDLYDRGGQPSLVDSLSSRELEVVQLVVEGRSSAEIADIVHLSRATVDTYRCRAMGKLGVENLPELVKFALQHGLTSLD